MTDAQYEVEHRFYHYAATGHPAGYWPTEYYRDYEIINGKPARIPKKVQRVIARRAQEQSK